MVNPVKTIVAMFNNSWYCCNASGCWGKVWHKYMSNGKILHSLVLSFWQHKHWCAAVARTTTNHVVHNYVHTHCSAKSSLFSLFWAPRHCPETGLNLIHLTMLASAENHPACGSVLCFPYSLKQMQFLQTRYPRHGEKSCKPGKHVYA